jgi:predicted N-acetyltransferase YhbS
MIRPITVNERPALFNLLDSTFSRSGQNYFANRFPLLFSLQNLDHVFGYFSETGELIGTASYYLHPLITPGGSYWTALLGAVAVHVSFRGKGVATELLHTMEKTLRQENVDFVFISGLGKLYRDWGAVQGGVLREYIMQRPLNPLSDIELSFSMEQINTINMDAARFVYDFYNTKPVCFDRTLSETLEYLKGNSFNPPGEDNVLWNIKVGSKVIGYIFTRELNEGPVRLLRIVEYAGVKHLMPNIARWLFLNRKIDKLLYHIEACDFNDDDWILHNPNDTVQEMPITGTIKILGDYSTLPMLPAVDNLNFV